MVKKIVFIPFLVILLLGSLQAKANEIVPGVASENLPEVNIADEVKIEISGHNVRVLGATGMQLEVYNLTGVRVAVYKIDCAEKNLQLNVPRGCYIVKVGKVTRKVSYL